MSVFKIFALRPNSVLLAVFMGSAVIVSGAWAQDVIRLSEPVTTTPGFETFGAPVHTLVTAPIQPTTLASLIDRGNDALGETVVVKTRVGKVCQKKGCFFIAQEGSVSMRVAFKDYAFFIPTDSAHKDVMLVGELIAVERSPAQSAHFAQDAPGAEVEPGRQFEFLAASVRIPTRVR